MEFSFYSPVKLVFGQPVATALPAVLTELQVERVLLLSDAGLAAIGLVDQLTTQLRTGGWQVAVFTEVQSNPTVRDVEGALALAKEIQAQALVALGGGSVIDVGKATGLLMTHGGRYAEYQWGDRPITQPILPLIAVPTTAGTGSEMTKVTVIEDEETHFKRGVLSPYLFAHAAVLDPALTLSLPPHLTAATGVDVVGHAIEAYVGRRANPITDALALEAVRRAWQHLSRATQRGDDLAARQEMMLASTLAGLAFDQSGLGIIHSLAGPVAGRYGLHHGLCIGLLLPHGLAYNLPVLPDAPAQGAGETGLDKRTALLQALDMPASLSDKEVIERIQVWLQDLGLPSTLRQLEITDPDLPSMAEEASRMTLLPNNPRPATADDCQRLLEGIV
ncbi:MAG: iron-containing alcohol dehydrogenase [Anaerolineae bacterium]|jgi:alcohol dehydrogenase